MSIKNKLEEYSNNQVVVWIRIIGGAVMVLLGIWIIIKVIIHHNYWSLWLVPVMVLIGIGLFRLGYSHKTNNK
jgi:uncharacterized membrane protein YiaA